MNLTVRVERASARAEVMQGRCTEPNGSLRMAASGVHQPELQRFGPAMGGRFFRYEFFSAIWPSRKVNTSHPCTSTRVPSPRVPVNVHSDTPRSPHTK